MKRKWLSDFDWEFVTLTNAALCRPKKALHRASSEGHDVARGLWEAGYRGEMTLFEAVELCRECHRLAPFCNFNGNTFVALIRNTVAHLNIPADEAFAVRSWMGHIVAGTASDVEVEQFRKFSDTVTEREIR